MKYRWQIAELMMRAIHAAARDNGVDQTLAQQALFHLLDAIRYDVTNGGWSMTASATAEVAAALGREDAVAWRSAVAPAVPFVEQALQIEWPELEMPALRSLLLSLICALRLPEILIHLADVAQKAVVLAHYDRNLKS